jgi:hypothetical protein
MFIVLYSIVMKNQTRSFWLVAAITILWAFMMRFYTPGNIVQFELAHSIDVAQKIIQDWGTAGIKQARQSIYLDFIFLILYSWAIGLGCKQVAEYSEIEFFKRASVFFMRVTWFAGCCDLIENLAMLFTLNYLNELTVSAAYYFALLKFILLITSLLFILLVFVTGIFKRIYHKKNMPN